MEFNHKAYVIDVSRSSDKTVLYFELRELYPDGQVELFPLDSCSCGNFSKAYRQAFRRMAEMACLDMKEALE